MDLQLAGRRALVTGSSSGVGEAIAEHRLAEATDDDWMTAFSANVLSAVGCARGLVPAMSQRGWGRVVTIGTRGVITPLADMVEYSAAKAALVNATRALARDLAGTGVTADVVSPGVILTLVCGECSRTGAPPGTSVPGSSWSPRSPLTADW
ncbi:MAG: SDR family NAD(P)-dependent oxidoreductase [Actinomycetota bacterium]|nr:SDR family NAD(P)-dependent oxidoreductase [Actinomycetota bacterium]